MFRFILSLIAIATFLCYAAETEAADKAWLSICIVIFSDGRVMQDYGYAVDEAACLQQIADVEKLINENPKVVREYDMRCLLRSELKHPGIPA